MASYDNGGLNIGSLEAFNIALLLKWRIIKLHSSLVAKGIDISGRLSKRVGNGSDTRFWEENWIAGNTLLSLYPRLYALELNPCCTIAERWNNGFWDWKLRRNIKGGIEQCQFTDLMARLSEFSCSDVPDQWWWDIDTQGHEMEYLSSKKSKHIVLEGGVGSHPNKNLYVACVFCWLQLSTVSMGTINDTMQWVDLCGMPEKKKKVIETSTRSGGAKLLVPNSKSGATSAKESLAPEMLWHQNSLARKISSWWNVDYVDVSSNEEWYTWLVSLRARLVERISEIRIEAENRNLENRNQWRILFDSTVW
ncbi:hypothetical protein Tco_0659824 [Tanacetum coccineum]